MFTGIIQEIGTVESLKPIGKGVRFRIKASLSSQKLHVNDSISINGACHTIVWKNRTSFEVVSVEETLKKTSLGSLQKRGSINLELPLGISDRFNGHIVLGHVDCVGSVTKIKKLGTSWLFTIEIPKKFSKYIIPRGSISIDGVSLTIAQLEQNRILISIIPHTMRHLIFQYYKINSKVNIEFDIVGKYIERMISFNRK